MSPLGKLSLSSLSPFCGGPWVADTLCNCSMHTMIAWSRRFYNQASVRTPFAPYHVHVKIPPPPPPTQTQAWLEDTYCPFDSAPSWLEERSHVWSISALIGVEAKCVAKEGDGLLIFSDWLKSWGTCIFSFPWLGKYSSTSKTNNFSHCNIVLTTLSFLVIFL
jgi:hypothetical protein